MAADALYYPEIQFSDVSLIKSMSLFYDHIFRIVPNDVIPNDPVALAPLVEAGAVGRPVDPAKYAKAASAAFLTNIDTWGAAALDADEHERRAFTRLHHSKIDEQVRRIFSEVGLNANADWLEVPETLASNYMIYLAREIASNNRLTMFTGRWDAWTAATYFNVGGRVDDFCFGIPKNVIDSQHPFALFNYIISEISPTNIGEIPSERILEFKIRRHDEIENFRKCIFDLADEVSQLDAQSIRRDRILEKVRTLEAAKIDYQKSASIMNVKGWQGFSTIAFPATVALASQFQLHPFVSTALVTGYVALGATCHLASTKRELAILKKNNPASFLVDLERDFKRYAGSRGPGDVNLHAYNCLEEFVND